MKMNISLNTRQAYSEVHEFLELLTMIKIESDLNLLQKI